MVQMATEHQLARLPVLTCWRQKLTVYPMFNTSASLFVPSFRHCGIDLRVTTSEVIGLGDEWPQMKEVFLWGAFHEMPLDYLPPHTRPSSSVWVIRGRRKRTNGGPLVTGEQTVCRATFFLSSGASISLFLSFIHPLIPPFFLLPLSRTLTLRLLPPHCTSSSPQLFSDCQARYCRDTRDHLDLLH